MICEHFVGRELSVAPTCKLTLWRSCKLTLWRRSSPLPPLPPCLMFSVQTFLFEDSRNFNDLNIPCQITSRLNSGRLVLIALFNNLGQHVLQEDFWEGLFSKEGVWNGTLCIYIICIYCIYCIPYIYCIYRKLKIICNLHMLQYISAISYINKQITKHARSHV